MKQLFYLTIVCMPLSLFLGCQNLRHSANNDPSNKRSLASVEPDQPVRGYGLGGPASNYAGKPASGYGPGGPVSGFGYAPGSGYVGELPKGGHGSGGPVSNYAGKPASSYGPGGRPVSGFGYAPGSGYVGELPKVVMDQEDL